MQWYADIDGDSGIAAYELGSDAIVIRFKQGGTYRYDASAPGAKHVRQMQKLARAGRGLNEYINRHVRGNFAAKLD